MPRYFFNVHYDSHTYVDEVGEDLADDRAAWHEATGATGESIKDLDGKLRPGADWCMEVVDGAGHRLYQIVVATRRLTRRG